MVAPLGEPEAALAAPANDRGAKDDAAFRTAVMDIFRRAGRPVPANDNVMTASHIDSLGVEVVEEGGTPVDSGTSLVEASLTNTVGRVSSPRVQVVEIDPSMVEVISETKSSATPDSQLTRPLTNEEIGQVVWAEIPALLRYMRRRLNRRISARAAAVAVVWILALGLRSRKVVFHSTHLVKRWLRTAARRVRLDYGRHGGLRVEHPARTHGFGDVDDEAALPHVGDLTAHHLNPAWPCPWSPPDPETLLIAREDETRRAAWRLHVAVAIEAISPKDRAIFEQDVERRDRAAEGEDVPAYSNTERQQLFRARKRAQAVLARYSITSGSPGEAFDPGEVWEDAAE